MSDNKQEQDCNSTLKAYPTYPGFPENESQRKNNFNKKIQNCPRKFEVLNATLELIHKKLVLTHRDNNEVVKQDAINELERFIKYCEEYKDELKSAINNDMMEEVMK